MTIVTPIHMGPLSLSLSHSHTHTLHWCVTGKTRGTETRPSEEKLKCSLLTQETWWKQHLSKSVEFLSVSLPFFPTWILTPVLFSIRHSVSLASHLFFWFSFSLCMLFLAYCPLSQMVVDLGDISLCSPHMEPLHQGERLVIPPSWLSRAKPNPRSDPCGGHVPLTGCPGTPTTVRLDWNCTQTNRLTNTSSHLLDGS